MLNRDKCMQQDCRKEDVCEAYVGREYSARKGRVNWASEDFMPKRGGEKALQAEPASSAKAQEEE